MDHPLTFVLHIYLGISISRETDRRRFEHTSPDHFLRADVSWQHNWKLLPYFVNHTNGKERYKYGGVAASMVSRNKITVAN